MTTDAQIQYELDKQENCPECIGKLREYYRANGPDDYIKFWTCDLCGYEASE